MSSITRLDSTEQNGRGLLKYERPHARPQNSHPDRDNPSPVRQPKKSSPHAISADYPDRTKLPHCRRNRDLMLEKGGRWAVTSSIPRPTIGIRMPTVRNLKGHRTSRARQGVTNVPDKPAREARNRPANVNPPSPREPPAFLPQRNRRGLLDRYPSQTPRPRFRCCFNVT